MQGTVQRRRRKSWLLASDKEWKYGKTCIGHSTSKWPNPPTSAASSRKMTRPRPLQQHRIFHVLQVVHISPQRDEITTSDVDKREATHMGYDYGTVTIICMKERALYEQNPGT